MRSKPTGTFFLLFGFCYEPEDDRWPVSDDIYDLYEAVELGCRNVLDNHITMTTSVIWTIGGQKTAAAVENIGN